MEAAMLDKKLNGTILSLEVATLCGSIFVSFAVLPPTPAIAQSPCGRAIMLNGYNTRFDRKTVDDLDRNNVDDACKKHEQENKAVQELAQIRVKARQQWRALDYKLQQCINDALRAEASSIERKIEDGILPVFENTIGYLNARQIKC